MNLDTCRCLNSSCPIRETCQRWTTRDEWPGRLKRYAHFEPGEDGVCTAQISVDSGKQGEKQNRPTPEKENRMNQERLAELRRDLYAEAYTSYLPKTVRELLDHIDGLKFANGVLDSAAKDAQAWSVRAQTAEAKCAQLEAQRGGAVELPNRE